MRNVIAAVGFVLIGAACSSKPGALPCTSDSNCPTGQSCGTNGYCGLAADAGWGDGGSCASPCTAGQTCELDAGTYSCVQTDCFPACDPSYQECNQTATPPVCVAISCHPACNENEQCVPGDGGFSCIPLTAGAIVVTEPVANSITGVITPLAVSATAGAPNGGPTKVELTVEQAGTDAGASIDVPTGNSGVYAGNINLADAGFTTGAANVFGTVYYVLDGGETSVQSPAIPIQIDVSAPAFGAPSDDKTFYSGVASPAQTATVTIPINDVGPAGVNPSSVILTANGHPYPANSTAYPDGGNGNYLFAVPVSGLDPSPTFLGTVSYSVTATDNVGNSATLTTGSLPVDNIPPSFGVPVYDAGWYGGDASINVAVNVQDQESGSGLDAGSVALLIANGTDIPPSSITGTSTYNFTTTGAAIQSAGQQGPVQFGFTAADNAGNVQTITDGGAFLVDLAPPGIVSTTVTDGTAVSVGGWYARDATGVKKVNIVTDINDGNGSGPSSSTVTVGMTTVTSTSGTLSNTGTTYSVQFPTSVQTAGSETPLAINVSASDSVGNTVGPTTSATVLQIDDKGPVVSAISIVTTMDGLGSDGTTAWFNQKVTTDILVNATVVDNGSGVDPTSLQLVLQSDGVTRVDYLATGQTSPTALGGNVYQFKIKRSAGPVAAGAENLVKFKVLAKDKVANSQLADDGTHVSVAQLGIDGKAPTVAVAASLYPAAKTGCDSAVDFCGHDGSHFWRKGDASQFFGFTGADTNNYPTSEGSGVDTSIGGAASTCSVLGATTACTSAYNSTGSQFQFPADFSTATFTTATDGTGTVSVTVTVKDRVGNVGTATMANVAVTRVMWVKKFGTQVVSFAGSPIVTSSPSAQIILGGTKQTALGPIASFAPNGQVLWQGGSSLGTAAITSNMAYSPVTKLLYVVPSSGATAYAYPLTATGGVAAVGTPASCTGKGVSGSPTIISTAGSEYVLVPDDTSTANRLDAFSVAAGVCSSANNTLTAGTWTSTVTTASTDGTNVFVGHDTASLAKATFSNGTFSAPTDSLISVTIAGNVAIAGDLFFGDQDNNEYRSFYASGLNALTSVWAVGKGGGPSGTSPVSPAVVSSQYVLGSFGKISGVDGHLYAFAVADGSTAFTYPATTATGLGALSPAVFGADNTIYLSHATSPEVLALAAPSPVGSGAVATKLWSFTGVSGISLPSNPTTEPTIDANGTMYFGDSNGDVFALITDSASSLAPAAGTNWPRVGFDNCNSGNTSFSCQ